MSILLDVLKEYKFYSPVDTVCRLSGGNINTTYKVTCADGDVYVLQKINKTVFAEPEKIMDNIVKVSEKLRKGIIEKSLDKLQVINIKFTRNGKSLVQMDGEYYRVYDFMPRAITYQCGRDLNMIFKSGEAYGVFAHILNVGEPIFLEETIKDFHNTPLRLKQLLQSYKKAPKSRKNKAKSTFEFLTDYLEGVERDYSSVLLKPDRIVHNDTKISNVAFDKITDDAIGILDLDTVMQGKLLYDFGDAVRSVAGPSREDEWDLKQVVFNLDAFTSFADGYISQVYNFANEDEIFDLALGAKLITVELAARFLTDYLSGDVYFNLEYEEQNLYRAKCQAALYGDICKKYAQARSVIYNLYNKYNAYERRRN